jgi:hypothetical protein
MANGWTLERRERQAALIRTWRPWERSTGPRSEVGKAMASQNSYKHGACAAQAIAERRRLMDLLCEFGRQRDEVAHE